MNTMITGAGGFVGLNVAEALLREGRDVVLFDARPALPDDARETFDALPGRATYVRGDVLDDSAVAAVLAEHDVDRVLHMAVITPGLDRERRHAQRIVEVNLMGTMAVIEAARAHGVRRFVYPSSASVYGHASFDDALLEEATTHPIPDAFYAISKYAAERGVLRAGELWGLPAVAARVGAVFGPWEHETGLRDTLSGPMQATRSALRGEEVVLPRPGPVDWVYARDVAGALIALLDTETTRHPVYNVSGGTRWTVADWCARLLEAYPGFSYRFAEPGEAPTIAMGPRDRSPLAIDRLREEIYRPRFDLSTAFDDYRAWIDARSAFWLESAEEL